MYVHQSTIYDSKGGNSPGAYQQWMRNCDICIQWNISQL